MYDLKRKLIDSNLYLETSKQETIYKM